jgi:hypothetical protein
VLDIGDLIAAIGEGAGMRASLALRLSAYAVSSSSVAARVGGPYIRRQAEGISTR